MTTPTRVYKFTQHLKHPDTGDTLCDLDALKLALSEHQTVKKWAVILHDEDRGADHVQGVLATVKDVSPATIARWLDLPEQAVQRARGGRAALVDCLRYLTHEDPHQHETLGKVRYSDDRVHASSGWDWRAEVDEAMEARLSGRSRGRSRSLAVAVTKGMSVREAVRRGATSVNPLRRNRAAYLLSAPLPPMRFTYVVAGRDTVLRDTIALGLARQLAGEPSGVCELPFSADEYDGERVILWRDFAWDNEAPRVRDWTGLDTASLFATSPSPRQIPTKHGMTQFVHDHLVVSGATFEDVRENLERACWVPRGFARNAMGHQYAVDPHAERTSFLHLPIRLPFTDDTLSIHVNAAVIGVGNYREVKALGEFRLGLVGALEKARSVQPPESRRELEDAILSRQFEPLNEARELMAGALATSTDDDFSDILDGLGERIPNDEFDTATTAPRAETNGEFNAPAQPSN